MMFGFVLFFGTHLVPSTPLRTPLRAALGEGRYKGLFSLLSLAGLVLIVLGYRQIPVEFVFAPKPWARMAALHAMPFVFILLASAQTPTHIRHWVRHPMMIGVLIWAVLHYFANGERAAVWLFGGFAVYAVISIISSTLRGQTLESAAKPPAWKHDIIAVVGGLVLFGVVLWAHGWLFGRPLLPGG